MSNCNTKVKIVFQVVGFFTMRENKK